MIQNIDNLKRSCCPNCNSRLQLKTEKQIICNNCDYKTTPIKMKQICHLIIQREVADFYRNHRRRVVDIEYL